MIKSFFAALSFISRLPVPARLSQGLEIEQYQRSIVTFPLVGLLLGAIAGAVALLLQPWCGVPLAALFGVLALALLFVFLFLAAQYESWSVPVAVILSLPIAGLGAYVGNWLCGLENNIYFQIGLVMLVGLVAKNAILIVEFAKEEVEKGRDVVSAALTAAHLRFRPIVMTSLAFILGLLPLVFASGPGSASRQGIGTGVFFGMLVAISVGIVFVPFFFVWVYRIKDKFKRVSHEKR